MNKTDTIRLQLMLDAAEEAMGFCRKVSRDDLDGNRILVLAVIKEIEIIGDLAKGISPEVKKEFSFVPWNDIIAMRNRFLKSYREVDHDLLWKTIIGDLPFLQSSFRRILSRVE
jgi:uncharacterized protein with HEPN domain